jgi:hypothetical protein
MLMEVGKESLVTIGHIEDNTILVLVSYFALRKNIRMMLECENIREHVFNGFIYERCPCYEFLTAKFIFFSLLYL